MFLWNDLYAIGHDLIDQQHKMLFEIGSQLEELVVSYDDNSPSQAIDEIYTALLDYVKYHFTTEEDLLRSIHYSNLENHIKVHGIFVQKLENLQLENDHQNQGVFTFEMLQLVADWIFEHIKGVDFQYKHELNAFV